MFKGSYVAVVTPFNKDLSINYDELTRILNWHVENGTDGIVSCGTTGEPPTMTDAEQISVIEHTVKVINKRIPVIAGVGSNHTEHGVYLSVEAQRVGADCLLHVNPYYNKGNKEGIYRHYEAINNAVNIPIILYNVPSRTGSNMDVDMVLRLSTLSNIIGVKEASGDLKQMKEIIKRTDDDFILFTGNDDIITECIEMGGNGVVSVFANVFPNVCSKIVDLAFGGKMKEAKELESKYSKFIDLLFVEVNPIPVKEAMNNNGFNCGGYRLPLCEMDELNKKMLLDEMKKVLK